jgi:predicted ATPase/DNA-binding SARP family transcriptional activator
VPRDYRILGPLQVFVEGVEARLGAPKQRAVLALLLLQRGEMISTDALIEALWPERPPGRPQTAIQGYVSELRRLIEPGRSPDEPFRRLETEGGGYRLRLDPDELDAERLDGLHDRARVELERDQARSALDLLDEGLALFRGPPLADFRYESWAQAEAGRLDELRSAVTELRIEARLALGQHAELVGELEALVAEQPLRERLRGQLMLALYRSGRQAEALAAYQAARDALVEELGIEPGPELRDLQRAILEQEPTLAPTAPAVRVSIPVPPTPLVGRQRELEEVEALLARPDVRLVTLTGPGGVGKTRLALELAGQRAACLDADVHLVQLAPITDPALVLPTIALALGAPGDNPEHLHARIRESGGPVLVVIDNFEQVADAAPVVADLLSACPNLELLVTSRERLHLSGEQEYALTGLSEPDATTLFAERARAADRSFEPNDAVTAICDRLDHLPLAIELAAARVRHMDADDLLARLDRRLSVLVGGARDTAARQQTLSAAIAWSYDLLDPAGQSLFRSFAVFSGGFTTEAAEAVCGAEFEGLARLMDKSLVLRAGRRVTLLETIREFALERLAEAGESEALRRAHAEYFLSLGQRLGELLAGPEERATLELVDSDLQNFRSAISFFRETGDTERAVALGNALSQFWYVRGFYAEGLEYLAPALDGTSDMPSTLLADSLASASSLLYSEGRFERSAELAERSLELRRLTDDKRAVAGALNNAGTARACIGDHAGAQELYQEGIALCRELGDDWGTATLLRNAAVSFREQAEPDRAAPLFNESLSISERIGDERGAGLAHYHMGVSELDLGNASSAYNELLEALTLIRRSGDRRLIVRVLIAMAVATTAEGRSELAVRLLGRADALLRELGAVLEPADEALSERALAGLGAVMDETELATGLAAGATLELDELLTDQRGVTTFT